MTNWTSSFTRLSALAMGLFAGCSSPPPEAAAVTDSGATTSVAMTDSATLATSDPISGTWTTSTGSVTDSSPPVAPVHALRAPSRLRHGQCTLGRCVRVARTQAQFHNPRLADCRCHVDDTVLAVGHLGISLGAAAGPLERVRQAARRGRAGAGRGRSGGTDALGMGWSHKGGRGQKGHGAQ